MGQMGVLCKFKGGVMAAKSLRMLNSLFQNEIYMHEKFTLT
jgi:hypothetical protein